MYIVIASMIIPKARTNIPIPIVLNPIAKIPVTNFLMNRNIIIAVVIAAKAEMKEAPSISTGVSLALSSPILFLKYKSNLKGLLYLINEILRFNLIFEYVIHCSVRYSFFYELFLTEV